MENQQTEIINNAFLVCLFSDPNFLAISLLENLLAQKCYVNIISEDIDGWTEKTKFLASKNRFLITQKTSLKSSLSYNYVIYCGGFLNKIKAYDDFRKVQSIDKLQGVKTIAVFPYEIYNSVENSKFKIDGNLAVVYLGDVLGPRMDINSNLLLSKLVKESLTKMSLTVPVGEVFYPVFVTDAARTISKWLFSFGPYGREIFLLGPSTSSAILWQEVQNNIPGVDINNTTRDSPRLLPRGYEIKTIPLNFSNSLKLTYKWLSTFGFIPVPVKKVGVKHLPLDSVPVVKTKMFVEKKRGVVKIPAPLLMTIIVVLISPIISLLIASGIYYVSYRNLISGKTENLQKSILIGKTFSVLSKKGSLVLSYIPFVGRVYRELYFISEVGESGADISINLLPVMSSSGNMFNNILGDKVYDPVPDAIVVKNNLEILYKEFSYFQSLASSESEKGTLTAKKVIDVVNFDKIKKLTKEGQTLALNISKLLGVDGQKTYLVLFQNNMELRPAGGFIGSYGLATFDNGRMSDLVVNDVYSADGQLNGHVEPPVAIKNYLGEANWFLRDSNWDPDFPTSAKRAEWFLDKEIGRTVDGVFSLDLFPIKEILQATGPIFLPDFNMSLDSNNLYEKTQSEVQDNFFPGTRKKESFLTALSRGLLSAVEKVGGGKKIFVLKALFESLEERHVQAYLHDDMLQRSISELLWDGSVISPVCGQQCYPDYLGIVEANVGVNKANYFVKRDASLSVNLDGDKITRSLTVNISNSANTALGASGRYKVYLRLIVPGDASIVSVGSVSQGSIENLSPEISEIKGRKEVGVLLEVLGGSTKTVKFDWRTNISGVPISSYGLYLRKQAGVDGYPFTIAFGSDKDRFKATPRFSLTQDGTYRYNTTLTRDFFSRITW